LIYIRCELRRKLTFCETLLFALIPNLDTIFGKKGQKSASFLAKIKILSGTILPNVADLNISSRDPYSIHFLEIFHVLPQNFEYSLPLIFV